ncbi:tetratricopeptide repeat protein [candidate division KSB1 bacterium]|nr:tetratricopeptide repeat protein [candidate division KSB1 bacterium]
MFITRATKVILFISAVHCFSLWAGEPKSADAARHGIALAYNMQLDEAERIFNGLIARNPDDPQGYVLKSVVYYYRYLFDQSTTEIEKQFIKLAKTGIDRAHKRLAKDQNNIEALFYAGTAHIYLAALHGEQGNWLQAFWNGKKGIQYLNRTVEIDSTYYDAYFGLGVYHNYADVMPKLVKTASRLIGVEGDRRQGLYELKLAAEKGIYARAEAAYFLGKIYAYMEKDHQKAFECFRFLSTLYPKNAGFLLDLGESLRRNGKLDEARDIFVAALQIAGEDEFPIFVKLAHYRLGNVFYEKNEYEKAIKRFRDALEYKAMAANAVEKIDADASLKIAKCHERLNQQKKTQSSPDK